MEYIKKYKNLGISYNISNGGDGGYNLGKHLSDETKKKIGEKNRLNMTGRKPSKETRERMSSSQSARYQRWSEQDRAIWGQKLSAALKGTKKPNGSISMKGNKNGALYSLEQVREIRKLHEEFGLEYTDISKRMNIPRASVYLIATYRRWKDVV